MASLRPMISPNSLSTLLSCSVSAVFVHQPLLQAVDLLIGEGVIQRDGDALGDLAQQLQVGGGKYGFIALRQFEHAEHGVAGHQRQQAQGLDLVAPVLKSIRS